MHAKTGQIQIKFICVKIQQAQFQLNWLIWKEGTLYNVLTE